jgi:hypothetical protein
MAIQNKRCGMLTSGVRLFHDNARLHTAACTRALMDHFNWGLFDHLPYSPDLASSEHYMFTYLKNWLESQRFSNNKEFMDGVKTWPSSQVADSSDTGTQNSFTDTTSASVPAVTTLRSSLSVCEFFLYNSIFLSLLVLLTSHRRLLSE